MLLFGPVAIITLQVQRNKHTFRCGNLDENYVAFFGVRRELRVVSGGMDIISPLIDAPEFALAIGIALVAGLVKGVVGFAMPLLMMSGMGSFMAPELALAGLLLPTLVTNSMQALRQGPGAAWQSMRKFRYFLISGGVTLVIAAQFVRVFPEQVLLLAIGIPVTLFTLFQLSGYRFHLSAPSPRIEVAVGGFAGILGGLSGVWGPPTVAYLTALSTPKYDQMRVQGVIYGLGSVALVSAHVGSGVLRAETWGFSLALVPPAVLGMWLGTQVMDRINQDFFRRATLCVLLLASANLVRRALLG